MGRPVSSPVALWKSPLFPSSPTHPLKDTTLPIACSIYSPGDHTPSHPQPRLFGLIPVWPGLSRSQCRSQGDVIQAALRRGSVEMTPDFMPWGHVSKGYGDQSSRIRQWKSVHWRENGADKQREEEMWTMWSQGEQWATEDQAASQFSRPGWVSCSRVSLHLKVLCSCCYHRVSCLMYVL